MKYFFTIMALIISHFLYSQSTGYLRYDSVRMEKIGGNSELILLNGSRDSIGPLVSKGNGRTVFRSWTSLGLGSSYFGRTDARNNTATFAYFSNATQNFTLDSNHLFRINSDTLSVMRGNSGFKTTNPTYTLTVGDEISGNPTLGLYASNTTAAFVQSVSGADLGIFGGGMLYLKPNAYGVGGQAVFNPNPTGYIKQSLYSGGGSILGNMGIDTLTGIGYQYYLEPVNVGLNITTLNLRGPLMMPGVAQITDSTGYDVTMINRTTGNVRRIPANLIGSTGGGSGTDNSNAGSGYRWLKPTSQGIKTAFAGIGILIDSSSNTDGLTFKSDTLVNETWSRGIKLTDSMAAVNNLRYWGTAGTTATAGSQAGSFIGPTNQIAFRFRTNNVERVRIDSTKAQVFIGAPTVDNVNALSIQGLSNSTFEGIKVWANNLSADAIMAWNGFRTTGAMAITSNTGDITLSTLSSKGVTINGGTPTSQLQVGASTTTRGGIRMISTGALPTGGNILAGTIDAIGDKLYYTIATGPAQKEIAQNDAALTDTRLPYTVNGRLATSTSYFSGTFLGIGLTNPSATITSAGSFGANISTVSTNTTLDNTYYTVLVDATGANRTITLPAASTSTRIKYNIKKIDGSANTVTIDGNGSETIDGALTQVISVQYASYTIQCDGTSWYIL